MRLRHETTPMQAAQIVLNGQFIGGPDPADGGMSARRVLAGGHAYPSEWGEGGVRLDFEWKGSFTAAPARVFRPGVVYDENWRMVVPSGTSIKLVGIDWPGLTEEDWTDVAEKVMRAPEPRPQGLRARVRAQIAQYFQPTPSRTELRLRQRVQTAQLMMRLCRIARDDQPMVAVQFPPDCTYRNLVQGLYPDLCESADYA